MFRPLPTFRIAVVIAALMPVIGCGAREPSETAPPTLDEQELEDVGSETTGAKQRNPDETRDAATYTFRGKGATSYTTKLKPHTSPIVVSTEMKADPRLDRVASTLLDMSAAGVPVTSPAIREALWWHGVPENSFDFKLFSERDRKAVKTVLSDWASEREALEYNRFGVAVREIDGGEEVVAIAVKNRLNLLPVPRKVARPRRFRFEGRAEPEFKNLSVVINAPDGTTSTPGLKARGQHFICPFRIDKKGRWQIEILGEGKRGPSTIANFPIYVGVSVKKELVLHEDKLEATNPSILERILIDEINRTRGDIGLESMAWSEELAKIARKYSEEMAGSGIIAHVSPTSGAFKNRVAKVKSQFEELGENLAKARTARNAHEGLMMSPAHRANILSAQFNHVGVGVAFLAKDGFTDIVVTQVFGRQRQPIDLATAAEDVTSIVNSHLEKKGKSRLSIHPLLVHAAKEAGSRCFVDEDPSIGHVKNVFGGVRGVRLKTSSLERAAAQVEKHITYKDTHIGVGVREGRDPELDEDVVCVVVLLGRK